MVIHLHQSIFWPTLIVGPALVKFLVLSFLGLFGSLAVVVACGNERKSQLPVIAAAFLCTLAVTVVIFAVALLALPEITLSHD